MGKIFLRSMAMLPILFVGMRASAIEQKEGVYQIGTPEDLVAFADLVNSGEVNANAVLTNDVDVSTLEFPMIGNEQNHYAGTFDGQHYSVNINLTVSAPIGGLFRMVNGTVKNLCVDGRISASVNEVGGICGDLYSGTIKNCISTVTIESSYEGDAAYGGICSRVMGDGAVIEDCMYAGKFNAPTAYNSAGLVGFCSKTVTISNCLQYGEFTLSKVSGSHTIARNTSKVQFKNIYFKNTVGDVSAGCTQITDEQLASGEVCFALNGDQSNIQWTQTLPDDTKPVPFGTGKTVFRHGTLDCQGHAVEGTEITYDNSGENSLVSDHDMNNGICSACGYLDTSYKQPVDGWYEISSGEDLLWYAYMVNQVDPSIKGKLIADIDMTGISDRFDPIGRDSNPYTGEFDGGNHKVSGFIHEGKHNHTGLFGYLNGATISNLTLLEPKVMGLGYYNIGAFVGYAKGTTNVQNCYVYGGEVSSENSGSAAVAGIVGTYEGDGTIQNCYSSATITETSGRNAAGIVANTGSSLFVIRNCVNAGNVTTTGRNVGGIVGWRNCSCYIENCYNIGTVHADTYRAGAINGGGNSSKNITNCYYLRGSVSDGSCEQFGVGHDSQQGKTVADIDGVTMAKESIDFFSGDVCYGLNGNGFKSLSFFQDLGSDEYPVLDSTHGVVYKYGEVFGNLSSDPESMAKAIENLQNACMKTLNEGPIATKSILEEYAAQIALMSDWKFSTIEELAIAYEPIQGIEAQLLESASVYEDFTNKVASTLEELESSEIQSGKFYNLLFEYLCDAVEPSDEFLNGSASYILENHTLTTEEVKSEMAYIDELSYNMSKEDYHSGDEISFLLNNADFTNGFKGWEGKAGTSTGSSENSDITAAECWNSTMDIHQTLTNLKNGVYELQVNGAFRPYPAADRYNTNYAAMLYTNDVNNYFQANIEDMILAKDAVDGENCYITEGGNNRDLEVSDMEGNVIGYTMCGVVSCCNAFKAGRYPNSVLVNVTDNTLTVGIKLAGTGKQPDWLGFGNLKLNYYGTMEEAEGAIDKVLASQVARANSILNSYEYSLADYDVYPNFSQGLREELFATIETVSVTEAVAEKYALVEKFSDLFLKVYDCKKAYIEMINNAKQVSSTFASMNGIISEDEIIQIENRVDDAAVAFTEGTVSAEEARSFSVTSQIPSIPSLIDDVYQIENAKHMAIFFYLANQSNNSYNAVLNADIEMPDTLVLTLSGASGTYSGTFDGQGHVIANLKIDAVAENTGLICRSNNAVISNITLKDPYINGGNYIKIGGIVGYANGTTKIQNCNVIGGTVISTNNGPAAAGGIVGKYEGTGEIKNCFNSAEVIVKSGRNLAGICADTGSSMFYIRNCANAGRIYSDGRNAGGIVGWRNVACAIENCYNIGEVHTDTYRAGAIHGGSMGSKGVVNCYYLTGSASDGYLPQFGIAHETMEAGMTLADVEGCTTGVEMSAFTDGEVCYLLNGDQSEIVWFQTIGTDGYPVLDPTHKTVFLTEDGKYANDPETPVLNVKPSMAASHDIYNLVGQKILTPKKGLYIVNGRKVLVK